MSLTAAGDAIGQTELPSPIAGPLHPDASGYQYKTEVIPAPYSPGEIHIVYEFCNRREDSDLSFGWIEPGFGLYDGAPLLPAECAYYEVSAEYQKHLRNSNLVFSDGATTVVGTYIQCRAGDSCDQPTEGEVIGNNYSQLRAAVEDLRRPTGRYPLSLSVGSSQQEEGQLSVMIGWQLPPMHVALTISRPAEEVTELGTFADYDTGPLGNYASVPPELADVIGPDDLSIILIDTGDVPNGELSVTVPANLAGDFRLTLTGASYEKSLSFFLAIPNL